MIDPRIIALLLGLYLLYGVLKYPLEDACHSGHTLALLLSPYCLAKVAFTVVVVVVAVYYGGPVLLAMGPCGALGAILLALWKYSWLTQVLATATFLHGICCAGVKDTSA